METKMKERPILFNGEMVRAILEGKKTQTRRVIKPQPEPSGEIETLPPVPLYRWEKGNDWFSGVTVKQLVSEHGLLHPSRCSYGKSGDRLWVRENFAPIPAERPSGYWSNPELVGKDYWYQSTDDMPTWGGGRWKPSIHMPRIASRINLEVTNVRVEQVRDISEEDAVAEGVTRELISSVINKSASKHEMHPEHWINGCDQSISYCRECANKEIERLKTENPSVQYVLDGGWGGCECDSFPNCETCQKPLDGTLTDYGEQEELMHFKGNGIDINSPADCYSLHSILDNQSEIYRIGFNALWDSINEKRGFGWSANPWVWVVEFRRVEE